MSVRVLAGGCLCGAVRYEAGPLLYPATYCHCTSCRRAAGAHAVAWFTVATPTLRFMRDLPHLYRSSPAVERGFCARCGTPLTYRHAARDGEIDVTVGSLDDPGAASPADHIWMSDAAPWDRPGDGLPAFATRRGQG